MELYREILENRENGAHRLVLEYGKRLYAAAVLLCANDSDAEELVFRTFEQAVKKIKLYDPQRDFFTWLYAIMRNFRRMDCRRRRVDVVPVGAPADLPESPSTAPESIPGAGDGLLQTIRKLPLPLREAVMLHYFEDKSVDEAAAILGVPPGTVKSRLHRAREALAAFLEGSKS